MRPLPGDQMRELMGVANLSSTADIKAARKAAKANYAAELQAQMRANEEAKLRERMERLGIARPPPLQAPPPGGPPGGGGPVSPGSIGAGMMGFGHASPSGVIPQPFQAAIPPTFPLLGPGPAPALPLPGSPGAGAPPFIWNQPPPYQPPMPMPYQPSMLPPYQPAGPLGNIYGMPSSNVPPPPFGGANGYNAQGPSFNSPPPPNFGSPGVGAIGGYGPQPGGGYAPPAPPAPQPLLPGPAPPIGPGRDTMQRLEQQARKDQYRLELEAQIREREERKAAEKARQREDDMRKEAEMAAASRDAMGRGGGGAPLRDAAGNVVANLRGVNGMVGMVPSQGPPSPGGMAFGMGPPGGIGPPGSMGMGGIMQPPPPPLVGSPTSMGAGIGGSPLSMMGVGGPLMGGSPPPLLGGPPSMLPQAGVMGPLGGGPGLMDGQPGVLPNFRFRSDNAYLTPKELDNKQRQMRDLQEALEQQIQEKRRAKELEKHREMAEIEREEARFRAGLEQQRGGAQDGSGESGGGIRSKEEVLADAWEKARQEAEELRRNKFAAKRGAGAVSRGPGPGNVSPGRGDRVDNPWGEGFSDGPEASPPMQPQKSALHMQGGDAFMEMHPPPPMAAPVAVRPSTPLVVEKVREVAAAELAAVKQELAAEAAQLREVVAVQGQQVAALKSHAERMEVEADRAREQVAAMRFGIVQQRGPATGLEYGFERQLAAVPSAVLADIDLDLPPTGAMLRRSAAPPPVHDMGSAIPAVNSSLLMHDNAAASSVNSSAAHANGAVGRPLSRLRAVNPLEASMAGESVFIYPNGREMIKDTNGTPRPQPLPFQSIQMAGSLVGEVAALPTVITTQELETGPVPITPLGAGMASSLVSGSGLASSIIGPPTASVDTSVMASLGTEPGAAPVVGASALIQQQALPSSRHAAASATPLDVDMVMNRNREKLEMLKGITDLTTGAASVEALDAFLSRYAAQRPGLPERTATPVLRICTPPIESAGASSPAAISLLGSGEPVPQRSGSLPASTPLYSSRANSVGPLPMGAGRVLMGGRLSTADSAGGNSTQSGSPCVNTLGSGVTRNSAPGDRASATLGERAGSTDSCSSTVLSSNDGGGMVTRRVPEVSGGGSSSGTAIGTVNASTAIGKAIADSVPGTASFGSASGVTSLGSITGAAIVSTAPGTANAGTAQGVASATSSGRFLANPPGGFGTGRVSRRNSFTGERSPQEGVLSQLLEPAPRPKTGPESGGGVGLRAPSPMAGRPPILPNTRYSNSGGSRAGTAMGGTTSGYVPSCASRPASGAISAGAVPSRPPSRPIRALTRGSEDGSAAVSSVWPSYNPSRESSAGGPRLSRSRSLSAHDGTHPVPESAPASASRPQASNEPERREILPPPPEDTLDVEMRKGLGAAATAPPTPPSAGNHGSLPGTPGNHQLNGDSGIPPFQIPRSPMLAGARRTGSAASQRASGVGL